MSLLQIHNYILLIAAGLIWYFQRPDAVWVAALIAASYACTATIGWWRARAALHEDRTRISTRMLWHEGATVVGLSVAVQVLFQFERLILPKLGSMQMLATYAVLAAVAGSAYRMIQLGNSFTLLPRIRAADTVAAARKVIKHEAATALIVSALCTVAVLVLSPLLFHYVLHDKYVIGWPLLAVAVAMGLVRVWEGFSTTIVSALGARGRLAQLSLISWLTLAVALLGAILGRGYGLVGILCGTLTAWLLLAGAGTWLAIRCLRERYAVGD